jgi:hypothetical protein
MRFPRLSSTSFRAQALRRAAAAARPARADSAGRSAPSTAVRREGRRAVPESGIGFFSWMAARVAGNSVFFFCFFLFCIFFSLRRVGPFSLVLMGYRPSLVSKASQRLERLPCQTDALDRKGPTSNPANLKFTTWMVSKKYSCIRHTKTLPNDKTFMML